MNTNKNLICSLGIMLITIAGTAFAQSLSDKERLGKRIFFDKRLSINEN